MPAITSDYTLAVDIEERRVHAIEYALYHPSRKSIVSITNHSLQELDPQYGATMGEAVFDLACLSDKPATGGSSATRLLEHLVPVGTHHVAAIFQSRCLVVWDLRDAVLQSVTEVEKPQKSVAALAASLCKDKWLFYASDGSNSIKVTAVDARDAPKKISRKAANRSSQLSALAYNAARRVLGAGASDGALQLWRFSEENSPSSGSGGTSGGTSGGSTVLTKDEAALVTPLFAAQTTVSPVVRMAFVGSGTYSQLLVVAYQNRVVEVWDLAPLTTGTGTHRIREPFRVAVFHCLPPQAMDFAKKNGDVSFHVDALAPLLLIHWHAYNGAGSCVASVELRLGSGGGSATTAPTRTPVPSSEWHEFVAAAPPSHEDGSAIVVFGTATVSPSPAVSPLMVYVSCHHHRALLPLSVECPQLDATTQETTTLSLSTSCQLSVEQYFKYQDVPATLLQVARTPDDSSTPVPSGAAIAFQLQRFSQQTGEIEKLDELPVWLNYQGRQLLPWKLRWNEQQSALCVQLRDPIKSVASQDDAGVSYVVLEIKTKTKTMADTDDEGSGGSGTRVSVTCGSLMDALDVCFCDLRSDDAKQQRPYVMLALASTGKAIGVQTQCDHVDQDTRIVLQQPVTRLFSTPVALSPTSPYASLVGSRLLYVLATPITHDRSHAASSRQTLVLSDDDLAVPRHAMSATATAGFQTRANGERIVDVTWNDGASTSTLAATTSATTFLVAVRTTQRVVILSVSPAPSPVLAVVAEYDLVQDLASPQSLLWMAQTLLFVTSDQHVRFVTPLAPTRNSHLLCSLPSDFGGGPYKLQLLSACNDRLCYAVHDARTLDSKTYMRPLAVCEPLLLGFAAPVDGRLKAIFERDFLVFLATGGLESRNPVTARLLDVLHHTFGWTDTVASVLDALLHPSSASVTAVVAGGGSGGGMNASSGGTGVAGASGAYKKLAHLSPSLVSSLLFHAQKWRDAVRVHLLSDPALEEYALADDDGLGVSSAKLPSRTGATSSTFQWLAAVLASVGQPELALKCLDLAGDDVAIVELLRTLGLDASASETVLSALQKDWRQLNPPLAAITKAAGTTATATPASASLRHHDLFTLLCCDQLTQTERRSRLLMSVRPLDTLNMKATSLANATATTASTSSSGRAGILYWKRLSPEDAKDVVGTSATPHFSTDEPKNPTNYALFHGGVAGSSSVLSSLGSAIGDDAAAPTSGDVASTGTEAAAAKMTIGPFLEDEDAVVAYWRFEEGATASDDDTKRSLDSMDTTKRENHLQILQFGPAMAFATSTAPVDKGEDGKLQEAFALRFPTLGPASLDDEWGAKCAVRPGSTLDIGLVFDEDPYRRKLTFEAWVRNVVLARQKQAAEDDDGDGHGTADGSWSDDATAVKRLVCRRGIDQSTWWEFGLRDGGALFLTFSGHTVQAAADDKVTNAAAWQHVAFSIDITSPKHATLKLYLQARCVATKEISNVDGNAKLLAAASKAVAIAETTGSGLPPPPSTVHLGLELTDYEMTEVRVWASARTAEQLSDMKENYLGIAEAKRRMKIAIHQRNCQCEKCLGRRTAKPAAGKTALLSAPLFPSTPPPAAGSARDRRRPAPKPQAQ